MHVNHSWYFEYMFDVVVAHVNARIFAAGETAFATHVWGSTSGDEIHHQQMGKGIQSMGMGIWPILTNDDLIDCIDGI